MSDLFKRKEMYKGSKSSPSTWKDVYRKKCFERLRARRASLIDQLRFSNNQNKTLISESTSPSKLVNDVMEVEWGAIHQSRRFPSLSLSSPDTSKASEEDETLYILEQIQKELQSEDEMMMNEFFLFESKELSSKIEMFQREEVICPLCKIRCLKERMVPTDTPGSSFQTPVKYSTSSMVNMVKCECGLSLSGQDLSLTKVRNALQAAIRDHENTCLSPLHFTSTQDSTGPNILITCGVCEWMTFLL